MNICEFQSSVIRSMIQKFGDKMRTDKSQTGLSLVNKGDVEACSCEFWRGTLLPIGIDELVRCHTEGTSRHSTGTKAVYGEGIPSNDVFEKCVASAIGASVWRRFFRTHSDTNATFSAFRKVEGRPTRTLSSMDSRSSLKRLC
ncbi:hypothetical protein TNCV_841351 [Trichonephila clavipes]|nr:hypothetical protein TNCV_841351 [Trichonephila clavipes]